MVIISELQRKELPGKSVHWLFISTICLLPVTLRGTHTQNAHCVALDSQSRCLNIRKCLPPTLGSGKWAVGPGHHQLLDWLIFLITMQVSFQGSKHLCWLPTETTAIWLCSVSHFLSRRFPKRNLSPWCVLKELSPGSKPVRSLSSSLQLSSPMSTRMPFTLFHTFLMLSRFCTGIWNIVYIFRGDIQRARGQGRKKRGGRTESACWTGICILKEPSMIYMLAEV